MTVTMSIDKELGSAYFEFHLPKVMYKQYDLLAEEITTNKNYICIDMGQSVQEDIRGYIDIEFHEGFENNIENNIIYMEEIKNNLLLLDNKTNLYETLDK